MKRTGIVLLATAALVPAVAALAASPKPRPSRPEIAGPNSTKPGKHAYVFSSTEKGVAGSKLRFRCGLDTTKLHACARKTTLTLTPGNHVLRAQAVDPAGRLSSVSRLKIFVLTPVPLLAVQKQWQTNVTSATVGDLFGVAAGPDGNVYVSDSADDTIEVYDNAGNLLRRWGSPGSGNGQFQFEKNPDPHDASIAFSSLAIDQRTGEVYVAEPQRVQKFDAQGGFETSWGQVGLGNGQFTRITDIALDASGTVYVLEDRPLGMGRVQEFTGSGAFQTTFARGQINDPGGIVVDGSGDVVVADDGANQIKVYGADGRLLRNFGQPGDAPGQLDFPSEMALSGNTLYVVDTHHHRIVRFDLASGTPTGYWDAGMPTSEPVGIAIDPAGSNVYVISETGTLTKYQLP